MYYSCALTKQADSTLESTHCTERFTDEFGLTAPIVQGPMGGVAGPELVAAVTNAGALGILPIWGMGLEQAKRRLIETRALCERPYAVNLRADLVQRDHIALSLEQGITIFHLFWGDPHASMRHVRASAGVDVKTIVTVGDVDAAKSALDVGATALIAQGVEAGGHVLSETPLDALLQEVMEIAGDTPVIAAGGLANASDVARVVGAGAAGALLGTRFVATRESMAHDDYKQALLEAGTGATQRSLCFDDGWEDAPHRTLVNSTLVAWNDAKQPKRGARPGEDDVVLKLNNSPFRRYSVMPPVQGMTGDIRAGAMYAGTGVAKIDDCPCAADIVAALWPDH